MLPQKLQFVKYDKLKFCKSYKRSQGSLHFGYGMQLVLSKLLLYGLNLPQGRSSVNYAIIKAYGYVRRITFKRFAQIHLRVLRYLSAFVHRQLSKGRVCSNEDFVRKLCAEAEAGDETVEAVSVEKVGGE